MQEGFFGLSLHWIDVCQIQAWTHECSHHRCLLVCLRCESPLCREGRLLVCGGFMMQKIKCLPKLNCLASCPAATDTLPPFRQQHHSQAPTSEQIKLYQMHLKPCLRPNCATDGNSPFQIFLIQLNPWLQPHTHRLLEESSLP